MSGDFVSFETIHRVVEAVRGRPSETAGALLLPFDHRADDPSAIGCALLELNRAAIIERYPNYADLVEPAPAYRYERRNADAVVQHKALSLFLAECSEGDVPMRDLYRALRAIKAEIAAEFVGPTANEGRNPELILSSTAEWEGASWD